MVGSALTRKEPSFEAFRLTPGKAIPITGGQLTPNISDDIQRNFVLNRK